MESRRLQSVRTAFSLLEVVAALVVVAMILVPTVGLMHDVLQGEATERSRSELIHLAFGKQNEYCYLTRTSFSDLTRNGDFSSDGHPSLLFQVTCSQTLANGGIPNRLMSIRTFAWNDSDGNRQPDINEAKVDLWTCVAKATP